MVGTVVRVKGIKRYRKPKSGKIYCYHRATGIRIDEPFGSGEFFARLAELDAKARKQAEDAARPNSLKALILNYKQSDNFLDLAPRTRSDYEKVFTFLEPLWNASLLKFTTPEFVKLRRKWARVRGRAFIDKTRAVMSILFAFAVEEGAMSNNPIAPTKRLKRPKDAKVYNRAWTIDFLSTHPEVAPKVAEELAPGSGYCAISAAEVPEALRGTTSLHLLVRKHAVCVLGERRLGETVGRAVIPRLRAIAESDPDREVRRLAGLSLQWWKADG